MISNFWYIGDHADFYTSRSGKVGASEVAALFRNPNKESESLIAWTDENGKRQTKTAMTIYEEKTGDKKPDFSGLSAEMGHFLENKNLELTIRAIYSYEEALKFRLAKERYEADCEIAKLNKQPMPSARGYQTGGPFLHSVEYYDDGIVVHPDCIFVGIPELKGKKERFAKYKGIRIDLSKPLNIEAKSANSYSAKRKDGEYIKGYDKNKTDWKGIPVKHYMQIQFQSAIFCIQDSILSLISDTSDFHIWKIKANKKDQGQIMDRVGYMVKCIQTKTLPKRYVINTDDVQACFPVLNDDYITISGKDQEEAIIKAAETAKEAKQQQEIWKQREKDAKAALAVSMRDFKELRVGSGKVCQWRNGGTGEGLICSFTVLERDYPSVYKYLEKKGMIKPAKSYRYVDVKWKGDEDV